MTEYKGQFHKFDVYVSRRATCTLLSQEICIAMGLVKLVLDNSVYGNIGLLRGEPDSMKPYFLNVARLIPILLTNKVNSELQRMKKDGIIVITQNRESY